MVEKHSTENFKRCTGYTRMDVRVAHVPAAGVSDRFRRINVLD